MKKRITSIDILRGIAIIGMIFCANIGFNSGLPAWMFHAQTPPPTYAFDPAAAGLTWVDLVFPFFLFSMGAAFPLAMRKKFENGASIGSTVLQLLKRWAILTFVRPCHRQYQLHHLEQLQTGLAGKSLSHCSMGGIVPGPGQDR